MKNDQVVGWYSAAYTLLAALMFIASAYNLAIFPSLSRYADSSKKLLRFGWEKSVKYLFMVSMPIAVGVTILSGRFISLFYSSSFSRSSVALVVLIWSLPWIFVNSINMRVLYATDNQKKATVVAFISMILNILLNLVLIPKYSYLGASLATVIVEIINVSVNFWLVFKLLELKIKISEVLPKTISASLIMGTFIYFLRSMNLAFLVLFSMVVYFVSLTILNAFDKEDRRVISELTAFANFNREHK